MYPGYNLKMKLIVKYYLPQYKSIKSIELPNNINTF